MTKDITASLKAFGTLGTAVFESRVCEGGKCQDRDKIKAVLESESSVPNVPESENLPKGGVPSVPKSLPPEQARWLPVAKQILAGEFAGAPQSLWQSVFIGLRATKDPVCAKAAKLALASGAKEQSQKGGG